VICSWDSDFLVLSYLFQEKDLTLIAPKNLPKKGIFKTSTPRVAPVAKDKKPTSRNLPFHLILGIVVF